MIRRWALFFVVFFGVWELLVRVLDTPSYILPAPSEIFLVIYSQPLFLLTHMAVTGLEIILGITLGVIIGGLSAIFIVVFPFTRRWVLPVLVISQAIPVFALAPILLLWFGFGMASKIAMASLIIFFPITAVFADGLRQTRRVWLDLAKVMQGTAWQTFLHIRLPAALPAFASGLRVAASVAPIGAIVGEWVGSAQGLGHVMLLSNARMQVDMMFAALVLLFVLALAIYFLADWIGRLLTPWRLYTA